jgi:hypothetical protein
MSGLNPRIQPVLIDELTGLSLRLLRWRLVH